MGRKPKNSKKNAADEQFFLPLEFSEDDDEVVEDEPEADLFDAATEPDPVAEESPHPSKIAHTPITEERNVNESSGPAEETQPPWETPSKIALPAMDEHTVSDENPVADETSSSSKAEGPPWEEPSKIALSAMNENDESVVDETNETKTEDVAPAESEQSPKETEVESHADQFSDKNEEEAEKIEFVEETDESTGKNEEEKELASPDDVNAEKNVDEADQDRDDEAKPIDDEPDRPEGVDALEPADKDVDKTTRDDQPEISVDDDSQPEKADQHEPSEEEKSETSISPDEAASSPTEEPFDKEKIVGKINIEETTVGQALHAGRVRKGWSADQVEQKTKIKKNFIEAIERDDYTLLPAVVYINAYIKTLGDVYGFNQSDISSLIKNLKDERKHPHVPEELLHHMEQEKHVNAQDLARVKRLTHAILGVAAVLIVVFIFFVVYMVRESPAEAESAPIVQEEVESTPFDSSELERFIVARPVQMTEMPVPSSGGKRDEGNPETE